MRTTIDIDAETMRRLRARAHQQGITLKKSVNAAVRLSLEQEAHPRQAAPYRCPTFRMGSPRSGAVDLDKALALASSLEDAEVARELELRK